MTNPMLCYVMLGYAVFKVTQLKLQKPQTLSILCSLCYVQGGVAGQRQEHVYSSWNFTPRAPEARRGQKGLRNADFGPS